MENTCLCGCSLRKGSLTFGILQLIGGLIGLIFLLVSVYALTPYLVKTLDNAIALEKPMLKIELERQAKGEMYDVQLVQRQIILFNARAKVTELQPLQKIFTPVSTIILLLSLTFACTLIHGVRTKSTRLIGIWMIYQAPSIVISIISMVVYYYCVGVTLRDIIQLISVFVLGPIFNIYALTVVHRYLKQLRDEQQRAVKPNV